MPQGLDHLSALDASFLHLETPEMPMHVGALHLLELAPERHADFADAVKRHVADRMHLAPVFHQKLALMPFEFANPVWVDDDDLDLDYHIRQVTLPKPGTQQQLEAYVGRLHSSLLDRSRPLWEFYVFSGLASGQVGFYSKIHHAALDGQGAMVLAQALLDTGPEPRKVAPPEPHPRAPYQPPVSALLRAALADTAAQCARLARGLPTGVRVAAALLKPTRDADGGRRILPGRPALAPRTLFNQSITNQRAFATASIALDEALAIGKAFGATLNDVLLAIVAGAVRRYLDEHGALPAQSLVAAVPVSLRSEGDTALNNQVSMMRMALATDLADPVARLRAIVAGSGKLKQRVADLKSVLPTDFPSLGVPWIMSALVALVGRARLADKLPPLANLVVSNVPGPRAALYLAGARMSSNFPISIVTHGLALNITVQSYAGALDFGVLACRKAVPDIDLLAASLHAAHLELLRAAQPAPAKRARKAPAAKPAAKRAPRAKKGE